MGIVCTIFHNFNCHLNIFKMIYIKITLTIRYLHIDIHVNTYAYIESHTLALKHKTIIYAKRQENYAVEYKSINVN